MAWDYRPQALDELSRTVLRLGADARQLARLAHQAVALGVDPDRLADVVATLEVASSTMGQVIASLWREVDVARGVAAG
jgi:hypothetical protein